MIKNILNKLRGLLFQGVPSPRVIRGTLIEIGHTDREGNQIRAPITEDMLKPIRTPRMWQNQWENPPEVYCQTCYRNLTSVGEVALAEGSVYCQGDDGAVEGRCIDLDLRRSPLLRVTYVDKNWPSLIQGVIDEGILVNYGPLEGRSINWFN